MEIQQLVRGIVLAVVVLAVTARAADAQVAAFVVDSLRSGVWVEAEVHTALGSDADRDSTGLKGTLAIEAYDQTIWIGGGKVFFADDLRLRFGFGAVGSITAVTEPSEPSLEVIGAGPAADLIDGAFTQDLIVLEFRGVLYLTGSGLIRSAVPDDPQAVASASTISLTGSLALEEDGTYQLTLPLVFEGFFDLGGGNSADIALDGTIYASGVVPSAVEDPDELPGALFVTDLYPQPVRDRAQLGVSVGQAQPVQVEVYDVRGRRVGEPVDAFLNPGRTELSIDVSSLSSGFYVAAVTGATGRDTIPFVVVR